MAGAKLYAADPDVHTTLTGEMVCCAIPKATKQALRSSLIVRQVMSVCRAKARVRGAQREPGQTIALVTPCREQISAISYIGCRRTE